MEVPVDTWHAWLGLAVASVVIAGVAASLPTRPPPDAAEVADTVDRTAVADGVATARHPLAADSVRIAPETIALRTDGGGSGSGSGGWGTSRARFAFGPVTPVRGDGRLRDVLYGTPPERVFEDPDAFAETAADRRSENASWRPAPESLVVRRVTWGTERVTLVGA